MIRIVPLAALLALLLETAQPARAGELVIEVEGAEIRSALAENRAMKLETDGAVMGNTARFANLLPDTPFDIELTLADGTVLAGVDMGWYEQVPPPAAPTEPMTDADREEIRAIIQDVPSFYDRADLLKLSGDHDRAVALVQLVRDRAFHASSPGEAIWRVELYYFKYQAGGWEKVQQQNKVLRRDRFRNRERYEDVVGALRWIDALGGQRIAKDQPRTIVVKSADIAAAAGRGKGGNKPRPEPGTPEQPQRRD